MAKYEAIFTQGGYYAKNHARFMEHLISPGNTDRSDPGNHPGNSKPDQLLLHSGINSHSLLRHFRSSDTARLSLRGHQSITADRSHLNWAARRHVGRIH